MRPFFFIRMGCLGWVLFGWLILMAYAVVAMMVLTAAAAIALGAVLALAVDWVIRKAVPSQRSRPAARWPHEMLTTSGEMVGWLGGSKSMRRAPTAPPTMAHVATVPSAPPAWYGDPNHPGQWRWWDGRQWTNDTAPVIPAASSVDEELP